MKILGKELTFNGNKVYHAGNKPTASEIGAAASSHTHNYAGSSSAGGNANAAVKLATARKIGFASFDGSANITMSQIMGVFTTTSSGNATYVNKWTKFATVDVSGGTYRECVGKFEFSSKETYAFSGTLQFYFRTGNTVASTSVSLRWTELTNSSYANCVAAVKVGDGKYDLYFKPIVNYTIMNIVGFANNPGYLSIHSNQTYVDSITAAVTSSLSGYVQNAATANTLTTARTINGTSFNGSADITTANWGTARNIQIGKSSKSVNGSANVTWSLSEIGAAAASHGRHMSDTCETITDWNNATKNGWYMGNNAANGPTTVASGGTIWYFGEVIAHNTNYVIQIVYQFTASTDAKSIPKYIRAKMNGTWGAWTNVTVAKAVPSNAVFTDTNTWRGVQDNLTSTATDQSLSANQGKVLKGLIDGKAASSHTHSSLTGTTSSTIAPSTGTGVVRYDYNVSSANAGTLPCSNNANGILTMNTHSGNYYSQLGFSSNGNLYYRAFNGAALDTTTAWKQVAFTNSSITGNAATATKLQTARTINGVSFDGTSNITVADNTKLPLAGGTMTGAINSSVSAGTYLAGNQGKALVNSTAAAGAFTTLIKGNSTNGYFTLTSYQQGLFAYYTAKSTVDAGTNAVTKTVKLIDEAGNTSFPGTVTANAFSGNASTATKLQTARTINDTSFDGSGNITTVNWGTARTIKIGNTAKSVNGSANVTWTLSEIGAADASKLLPLTGGTLTGDLTIKKSDGSAAKLNVHRTINSNDMQGTIDVYNSSGGAVSLSTNNKTSGKQVSSYVFSGDAFWSPRNADGVIPDIGTSSYRFKKAWLAEADITGNATIKGVIYGKNNIALDRGTLWIQSLGGNATCDYLRFGTNIIASNDSKQIYLIDTAGNRANLDVGQLTANGVRLTNGSYPSLQFSSNVRIEYDVANDALYAAGTKSTSSGLREFRATQCNSTVNAIIAGKRLFIQSGTPSGVATGDVWIQI